MPTSRLDALKGLLELNPNDSFARYGLAQELARLGAMAQAVEQYEALMNANPDYAAAYFHCGQSLEKLGRLDDARAIYEKGVATTTRIGDLHTRSELQAALDML